MNEALATYLNDHLAGSVGALELLEHLVDARSGTPAEPILEKLRIDIMTDRQLLEDAIADLGVTASGPRLAAAWIVGKLSELKLRLDDPTVSELRRLEGLEAVALGIEGKIALWQGLSAVADAIPELGRLDYPSLLRKAEDQRCVVEELRLHAAKEAFAGTT